MPRGNPDNLKQLTEKQKAFCEEYLIDFNATQAAVRAGYSLRTANEQGARLLANVSVQGYLGELKAARAERVQISQDEVLKELHHIAFDDIRNYLEFRTDKVEIDKTDDGKPVYGYRQIVDVKDSREIDTRSIQEISLGANGTFKFKLYGKDEALTLLGKHLGIFVDKSEISGRLELGVSDKDRALIERVGKRISDNAGNG